MRSRPSATHTRRPRRPAPATDPTDRLAGDYLTPAEVAARLRIAKVDGVLRLIHAGELPAVNVSAGAGRATWRIAPSDLDVFLADRRAVRSAPPTKQRRAKPLEVTRYF